MISLEKVGNAIKFTFTGNDHYLQDGTIEVPLNSLMLVTDESDMFTFKKSATNDIFISGLYSEIGMSKSQLESWFKENAVGGAGGTDEEKVQEMIDASISGKADVSALNVYADSVKYNPTTKYVEFYHNGTGGTKVFEYDASAFVIDGMVQNVEIKDVTISGEVVTCLVISFNTDAGKQNISIPISEIFDANNYYNKAEIDVKERVTSTALNDLEQRKLDASAYTPTDLSNYYNKTETNTLLGGKQDTLASGTNIKTINNESILGSGNITIESGKALSGGTNISITTGETADTINCTIPYVGSPSYKLTYGYRSTNNSQYSLVIGALCDTSSSTQNNIVVGYDCHSRESHNAAFGLGNYSNNRGELSSGYYNVSNTGSTDADKTLFSVGNGESASARHNAFDVRQNGDIYITLNGQDVKLQDKLGGTVDTEITSASTNPVTSSAIYNQLGGLKFIKLTQSEYDALATKDGNTMYVIVPAPPVPKVTAKYNITDIGIPTQIISDYAQIKVTSMIVDGGSPQSFDSTYDFSTTGEHTVEFILTGSTAPDSMFYGTEYGGGNIISALTSVVFSDSVTNIGRETFYNCSGLTSIDFGHGVTGITLESNFYNCSGLTSIVYPEQLVNFNVSYAADNVYQNSGLIDLKFESNLSTFNYTYANVNNNKDWTLRLGSGVTTVNMDIIPLTAPKTLYIEATTPPEIAGDYITGFNGFDLYVPASAVSAYQNHEGWRTLSRSINAIPTA